MTKNIVRTAAAPPPVGPYSQGIRSGNLLFVAGQGPFDPKTDQVVANDITSQTRQTLGNIKAIVEASGFTLRDVVVVNVFLKNPDDFGKMNEVYKTFFTEKPPTRTTVSVSFVVPGMLIEANATACRE
jgi:2-iminobutanoate/2-iminopropanoate deaminase